MNIWAKHSNKMHLTNFTAGKKFASSKDINTKISYCLSAWESPEAIFCAFEFSRLQRNAMN